MSQIILSGVGNLADNVTFETDPDLTVGDDDVLIALEAAVVNPVDFLYAAGWYGVLIGIDMMSSTLLKRSSEMMA